MTGLMTAEAALQSYVVDLLRQFGAPGLIFYHPVNEGRRTKRLGGHLKRIGMLAGVADLALVLPGGKAAFLELKTPTGRMLPDQRTFRDLCDRASVPYAVARTPEEAAATLRAWGALKMQARAA